MIVAEQLGTDILEMDIRLTKDRQIVVIHDETLNRTTSCEGPLSHVTLSDLSRCRIVNRFPTVYMNSTAEKSGNEKSYLTVPTLESVFEKFPSQHMVIEIKENKPELVAGFCALIRQYHKTSHILVGSFHQSALELFRKTCPQVATSATPKEVATFVLLSKLGLSGLLSPSATALQVPPRFTAKENSVLPDFEIVTASLVRQAHAKNLAVHVWTINEADEMAALIALGVDGIMTDFPDRLLSVSRHPSVIPVSQPDSTR
jgi:glycerophosphoryl diester phosphodiesterase